jgi:uncharacterized protein (DUF2252 family)
VGTTQPLETEGNPARRGRAGAGRAADDEPSVAERARLGKAARARVPLDAHAAWAKRSRAPTDLLAEEAKLRIPELVPLRHRRMLAASSTYYRGAALPMAADLATTPSSGFTVQCCGDAHLGNFGFFASPERHLVFDINDFDETAPGPWEWDVKRLAVSLEVIAREHELQRKNRTRIVESSVRAYRNAMREFAGQSMLEVWYAHLDLDDLLPRFRGLLNPKRTPAVWRAVASARAHDSHQAVAKLCRVVDGQPRIVADPPLIVPVEDLASDGDRKRVPATMRSVLRSYVRTLAPDRQHLLDQYEMTQVARKVVGVASVGTYCWIGLLIERGPGTPLLLQVKEARASVLERYTGIRIGGSHGARVVNGQRWMQASSDLFLGWTRMTWGDDNRDYYVRQLRDWKGSIDTAGMTTAGLQLWGTMCGWTLARAHARSGDRIAIGSYLGKSETFDVAVGTFAAAYADQVDRDYHAFRGAVTNGELSVDHTD